MNTFRIGSLTGVLLLCSCQAPTPDQARLQEPLFQGQSTRTVPQLSDCIYRGWSTTSAFIDVFRRTMGPDPARRQCDQRLYLGGFYLCGCLALRARGRGQIFYHLPDGTSGDGRQAGDC